MQTLELQVERLENALTLDHLATLPKRNKDHFLLTFAHEQQQFFQHYLSEGQRVARSWDDSGPVINRPSSSKNDSHLQVGFGTPVLKARLDLVSRSGGRNQTVGGQESSKENERQSGHSANVPDVSIHDFKLKALQKKNVGRVDKKRSKEHNLPSHSDIERRADRRQRKKIKRNIMNPEVSEDSDNQDKPSTTRKEVKRQSKLRKEFALMHGFSSTNVGKNRLTLNPGRRDIGVFQKGKASEKTDVVQAAKHKRQESGFHFSEATFLDKPRQKVSKIDLAKTAKTSTTRDSTVVSSASASIPASKSNDVSKMKPQSQDEAQTGYNPANSIVWDIEQAGSLGSGASSGVKQGAVVFELARLPVTSNEVPGNEALATDTTTLETHVKSSQQKFLCVTQLDALSSPSLGPSQSASQIGLKTVNVALRPTVPSKYFESLPPRLGEPHLGLTCGTINQPDAMPPARELSNTILQMPEPVSHLRHSASLSARSYCDGQDTRPDLILPMQPSYDWEVSVYSEGYPAFQSWSPVAHLDDGNVEPLDNIDIADRGNVSFDDQFDPSHFDDEVWPLDYTACEEPGKVDQICDTSFIPFSGHQSAELHNSVPPSMWLSDVYCDVSESFQGMAYQYSGGDSLSSMGEDQDQRMQSDGDSPEHEAFSSMSLELCPDVIPNHRFWQGRSLLYGLCAPQNSLSLHKLSNVEADVARQLQLDHWQRQKL